MTKRMIKMNLDKYTAICELLPEEYREEGLAYILWGDEPSPVMASMLAIPYPEFAEIPIPEDESYDWGAWLQQIPILCCGSNVLIDSWVRVGGLYGHLKYHSEVESPEAHGFLWSPT